MRAPFLLLLATGCVALNARALDLTPVPSFKELEGFKIPVTTFLDGNRKVVYEPPREWELSGGGAQLRLFPSKIAESEARFQLYKRDSPASQKVPEDLKKSATTLLPGDSADIRLVTQYKNPFMLGATGSSEFIFSYTANARLFSASIAIVDLSPRERLVITTTARAPDFNAVRLEVISSLFRWTWE